MRRLTVLLAIIASPALAELSADQQAAVDRLQPVLSAQLGDAGAATALAECIADTAKSRELTTLAEAEEDSDAYAVANEIMTRPEVMACVTEKLSQ